MEVLEATAGTPWMAWGVVGLAGLVAVGVYYVIFAVPAEQQGKRAVELGGGSLGREQVADNYKEYATFFEKPKEIEKADNVPKLVDTFYNLVTDIYEWGWGQSFHFSPDVQGKSNREATRLHEVKVAELLKLKPGMKVLDAGCGVGGPMRAIAAHSGSKVVGITINDYQVARARSHNKKAGLDQQCEVVCGDFLHMPFPDNSFDAAYSIEATCHAPILSEVYQEIYRVLKPGQLYVTSHIQIEEVAKEVGFEVLENYDLALPPASPWWKRLKMGRVAWYRNHVVIAFLTFLGIAPQGVVDVHEMLFKTAAFLTKGGETGIFTPMHLLVLRKPSE
ncbi:hypothetical protein R1sor_002043 [Riccia sorocarpa]|uniref:Methyltransferase n=1 Tax=Riccia sorocarpa TaxID=122646 RepID=A0ABD3GZB1_9MARC